MDFVGKILPHCLEHAEDIEEKRYDAFVAQFSHHHASRMPLQLVHLEEGKEENAFEVLETKYKKLKEAKEIKAQQEDQERKENAAKDKERYTAYFKQRAIEDEIFRAANPGKRMPGDDGKC
jgi:hypothetical protein